MVQISVLGSAVEMKWQGQRRPLRHHMLQDCEKTASLLQHVFIN